MSEPEVVSGLTRTVNTIVSGEDLVDFAGEAVREIRPGWIGNFSSLFTDPESILRTFSNGIS